MELTFGEQIKIILKRKNMTIRQLAELIEMQTGRTMSRQNLTQKLNRDNFQEQDMKEIAQALGCVVQISVIDPMEATVASLQALMPPKPSKAPDETVVLSREALEREEQAYQEQENKAPSAPAAGRAREESAESDVLKEIEMALMESIQKEMSQEKEELKTSEAGPEKPEAIPEAPEAMSGEAGPEPGEPVQETDGDWQEPEADSLSWARKKPSVWPKLFVPGEEPEAPADLDEEPLEEPLDLDAEPLDLDLDEEPSEVMDLEELPGGDMSGVSAPYAIKREEEGEPDTASFSRMPEGDVSYASAPYVIPREPEEEPKPPAEGDFYVEIPPEELPGTEVDDAAETVQEFGGRRELDMEEKLAAWDAAVKKRLEQPILKPAEERREQKDSGEGEEPEEQPEAAGAADIDPRTGEEYETNTVRRHPSKPDTLLVYDREEHRWIEQAERAFQQFQMRKRAMLGKDYEPPVYLD